MNGDLPKGWVEAELKDLVGLSGLFTDGDWILSEHLRTGVDVRLIQLADVGIGRFLDKSRKFISDETAESLRVTYLRESDVLISRMADPLARACLFPQINIPAITAVDVAIARCDGYTAIPAYLMYLCNSHHVLVQAEGVAVGTTRKRISRKNLEKLYVPLPPLPEQRRIVAKLEKLLGKVDACQKRLGRVPLILKRFRQSVLAAACSGRLTGDWRDGEEALTLESNADSGDIPVSWSWRSIEDLANPTRGSIQSGPFGSNLLHSEFQPTGLLAIGIDNVLEGSFSLGKQHRISPLKYEALKKYTARPLDVLVTVMATIGRCCVIPEEVETAIITKHVYRISCNQDLVDPFYLQNCILGSSMVQAQIQAEIRGATRPGINGTILKKLLIPLPPLSEQKEIVRRVEALFSFADQIEARYQKAKAHVDKLTQSILAKAFRGELVPQDPNDEPAAVLLERIKRERDHT
jgi:type I restriction enzyme, S subunit